MNTARNSADCKNGSRNISATPCGLPIDASVKKPKYVTRNVITSANCFSRSLRNPPTTSSKAIQAQGRSASAPHQLSPLPKAIGAQSKPSAAGLKICPFGVRISRLDTIAKTLVQPTTNQDSLVDRMKNT